MAMLPDVTASWPAVLTAATLVIVTILLRRTVFSPIRSVPGPFLASVTRFWHIRQILAGDQNVQISRLHDKHGHFVRIAPNEVSVSHPDGIRKILLATIPKADWYKILSIPDYRFQMPISATDPKEKLARSRHFASGWTLTSILQNEPAVDGVYGLLLDRLDEFAGDGKQPPEPVDLGRWLTFAMFDTVGEAVFSRQFGFLREGRDVGNTIANQGPLNAYATIMGFFRWVHVVFLGNPIMTALKLLPMGHLFDTTAHTVEARLKNDTDSPFDILAHWLRALERDPEGMCMRDVYAMATGAIGAGSDTVTCALQSFFYHTLRTPGTWARIRAEMAAARRDDGSAACTGSRVVSFADAARLPYLQACIREAQRVCAPVPMQLPRVAPAPAGLTVGDRHFPPGTVLSVNPWVVHRSRELWGPDADEFRPERWLQDDIAEKEKYYIPFGAGYNSCPGQNMAKMEISKITATIIRDYDVRQADPKTELGWRAYFILILRWGPCFVEKRRDAEAYA